MNIEHRAFLRMKLAMRDEIGYRPSYGAVFEQLMFWEHSTSGSTCPGQRALARALGYCRETVNRATRWLEIHGYIRGQQRYRRLPNGGCRYLSKRYWIARELGQVAYLLGKLRERGWALFAQGKREPLPLRFRVTQKPHPHQEMELNPAFLVSPKAKERPPDAE